MNLRKAASQKSMTRELATPKAYYGIVMSINQALGKNLKNTEGLDFRSTDILS